MKIKDNIKHITHPLSVAEQNRLLHWLKENIDILINNKDGNKEVNIEEIQEFLEQKIQDSIAALEQEIEDKQDTISRVSIDYIEDSGSPNVSVDFQNGEFVFTLKNMKMKFSELTEEEKAELKGEKGQQGDSVLVGQGDLPLAHVLGDSNQKAMSQQGVTDTINDSQVFKWGFDDDEDGSIPSLIISNSGVASSSTSDNVVHYAEVKDGDIVRLEFTSTSNTTGKVVAFFKDIPEADDEGKVLSEIDAKYFVKVYKIDTDGYLCVSANGTTTDFKISKAKTVADRAEEAYDNTVYVEDTKTVYNRYDCTIPNKTITRSNGSIFDGAINGYTISGYIELPANAIIRYKNLGSHIASTYCNGYLYNASKVGIIPIMGSGVIDLHDYPEAKYLIIGQSLSFSDPRVVVEVRSVETKVKDVVAELKEEIIFNTGRAKTYGQIRSDGNNTPTSAGNYYAIGIADSNADNDGIIKNVTFDAVSTGTVKFMIGVHDTTHNTFDCRAIYDYSVNQTGVQTLDVNMPIKKGETLLIDVHNGISVNARTYNGELIPEGAKPSIIKTSAEGSYGRAARVTINLTWVVESDKLTIKDVVTQNSQRIEQVNENIFEVFQRFSEFELNKTLIKGKDGKVYRFVVDNGVLSVECTTYQHILILAHSFGAIVTQDQSSVWERGMSSSKVEADWVSHINSVFQGNVQRVKMVEWEQAFPNPASTLPTLLDNYLTNEIDAIFIMCGANVPSSYRTRTYGETNFAALVDYCKEGSPNADIFVCSPGYTDDTNDFNVGIEAGAESEGATYISTYCTYADKLANYGDVVFDFVNDAYSFVINSGGRTNHPNDIWHLYMANCILRSLGYSELNKLHNISYNSTIDYRGYTRWVEGGHCTVCTFGNTAPTASIVDASGNNVACSVMSLSSVTWENTPPRTPTYAIHFDMPASAVTISISE